MKIVAISDTHNAHKRLIIPPCDLLIHAGDCTNQGYEFEFHAFMDWFALQPAKYKLYIPGNHDYCVEDRLEKDPDLLIEELDVAYGVTLLCEESFYHKGLRFYGTPWQTNLKFSAFYQREEHTPFWNIPADVDVLITHCPPYGVMDKVNKLFPGENDYHVGSKSLGYRLTELTNLKAHIFGHIHEGYGQTTNNHLTVNASNYNNSKNELNPITCIEIPPGLTARTVQEF